MKVKLFVEEGWPRTSKNLSPEVRPFYGMRDEIYLENDVLMMRHRIVVPKSLIQLNVLEEIHASHLGINKTKGIARSYICWPNIGIHIENLVKGCKNCYNELQDPPMIETKQWPPSKYVWERILVDFLGPMNGNYYFVLIDAYSKWPEVFKIKDIMTETTINKLRETFARYGLP
jgi:hypothetical protein